MQRAPSQNIAIGDWTIGENTQPLIIAELSANHGGSLDRALELVEHAHRAGAHAIKLQTYTEASMVATEGSQTHRVELHSSPWRGQELRSLYRKAHTPREWHGAIFERARSLGLIPLSTPFDESAVDFLLELGVPAFKVASLESTHLPLLKKIASTGKPLLLSIGATTLSETFRVIEWVRQCGCDQLILLMCSSQYPTPLQNLNLNALSHLRALSGQWIGFSDHTLGIGAAVAATALGAKVIEKHLTLSRAIATPDRDFSLEPDEFRQLSTACAQAHAALGKSTYELSAGDLEARGLRRSLFAKCDIDSGAAIEGDMLVWLRPAIGISPLDCQLVVGRIANCHISAGSPITWSMLR